jgi:uncharacterized protein
MRFYNRTDELAALTALYRQSKNSGKMAVVTGRRRVGKTLLSRKFMKDKKGLYLFVSKKSERLLCDEFLESIRDKFDLPIIGEINSFKDVFRILLEVSISTNIVVVIDEFQEFFSINKSVYSEMQNLWDSYKNEAKILLIAVGSIHSLMVKIFQDSKEPLFGRADRILYLQPFLPDVLKEILDDNNAFSSVNLFDNFIITGGVPRYQEILVDNGAYSGKDIIDFILKKNSPFLDEGKNILLMELGKDYGIYFSILELLANGKTSRSEIESILRKNTGGYLARLEREYDLITIRKPIIAKPGGKIQKYYIKDNFLSFWFRFLNKNRSAVENENFSFIKKIWHRDYSTYSGSYLEKLFHILLARTGEYNLIGNYWERGNVNEIDIVAVNDLNKQLLVADVKLNPDKINLKRLREKSVRLIGKYPDYSVDYKGFSLEDISTFLR